MPCLVSSIFQGASRRIPRFLRERSCRRKIVNSISNVVCSCYARFFRCIIERRGQVSGFDAMLRSGNSNRATICDSHGGSQSGLMVFRITGGINETIVADKCADVALSMRVWSHCCVERPFVAFQQLYNCPLRQDETKNIFFRISLVFPKLAIPLKYILCSRRI